MPASRREARVTNRFRSLGLALCGCLTLLPLPACKENDEALVEDIGVTRLYLVDVGLRGQSLVDPEGRIQAVEWDISEAVLDVNASLIDLLVDPTDPCKYADTVRISTVADGGCATGVVLQASDELYDIDLALTVSSMQVRRAEPLDLSQTIDFDGDGVPNDGDGSGDPFDKPCGIDDNTVDCDDNCPLVANPDQADNNADGVGNSCTVFDFFSGALRDSDADGVADISDNCVWVANPDQADTDGPFGGQVPDGIGDACTEQIAQVAPFVLEFDPTTLLQQGGVNTFITVDFDDQKTLTCDWEASSCTLDPSAVVLCTHTTSTGAVGGC